MDRRLQRLASIAAIAAASLALAACAGREARDFRGRWVPLNTWAEDTQALPLRPVHVFEATPMDATLHALLARWARDGGAALDYRHPDDFILHRPVAGVRATTLGEAVARLGEVFSAQGVAMRVEADRVVVETSSGDAPAAPAARSRARGGS